MLYENNVNVERNKTEFLENLEASLDYFRELTVLTNFTYVSISDVPATHPEKLKTCPYHWSDVLPLFEQEMEIYRQEIVQPIDSTFYLPALPGLAGIWYGEPDLMNADHSFTALDLDYNWDDQTVDLGKNWSVRWFGFIGFPVSGETQIIVASDRGLVLKIDRIELITWAGEAAERRAAFKAEKNRWYPIDIIYNHKGGDEGNIKIQWQLPVSPPSDIPAQFLKHSLQQKRLIENEKKLR
jgi:hypothetical protein